MVGALDPQIEILFRESSPQTIRNRYELPIFFIVGGADDFYLASLLDIPVEKLRSALLNRSVDNQHGSSNEPFGVYASRSTVLTETWARTFPISLFLQNEWPILDELSNSSSQNFAKPDQIQQTWILRALDRIINITTNLTDLDYWKNLYEKIRDRMLAQVYPDTLSLSIRWDQINDDRDLQNLLQRVLRKLTEEQLDYPLTILVDDLPIQYNLTFRDVRDQLVQGPCSSADLRAIRTSVELILL